MAIPVVSSKYMVVKDLSSGNSLDKVALKLVDTHAHLSDSSFDSDLENVVLRAREKGVVAIIDCGLGLEGGLKSIRLAEKFKGHVYSTIGIDYGGPFVDDYEKIIQMILENRERIIGVGEVGLDFYTVRRHEDRLKLVEIFERFIEIAERLNLPLVIHSRSAGRDAIEILLRKGARRVMMHAFDGKASSAIKGVEAGFLFSIPPSVVRSRQKQKLVERIPLENILLESDSPVLGVNPLERNEPSSIIFSLQEISWIKRLDSELVAEETTRNACMLFRLSL
ncbi:MAG: TatD family hydrolase [Thermoproteota archaeon]